MNNGLVNFESMEFICQVEKIKTVFDKKDSSYYIYPIESGYGLQYKLETKRKIKSAKWQLLYMLEPENVVELLDIEGEVKEKVLNILTLTQNTLEERFTKQEEDTKHKIAKQMINPKFIATTFLVEN